MSMINGYAQTFDMVGHGNPIMYKKQRFHGQILHYLRSFEMFKARHSYFTRDIDHINWWISWNLDKIDNSMFSSDSTDFVKIFKSNPLQILNISIGRQLSARKILRRQTYPEINRPPLKGPVPQFSSFCAEPLRLCSALTTRFILNHLNKIDAKKLL